MNNPTLHVGDVGTILEARVLDQENRPIPLDTATSLIMRFSPPGIATFERPAFLAGNGLDGRMIYITIPGDLMTDGVWQMQGFVSLSDGEWSSSIYTFKVEPNL